ncbi:hypothetical protein FGF1_03700 [Flavobacteriaceae bacterium GF1]
MKVKDLKNYLETLPEDMPIGLLDLTTDDVDDANYPINESTLSIEDYVNFEVDKNEILGKMLFFTFKNKLNENPIT